VVVIEGDGLTVMLSAWVAVLELLSVTWAVKLVVPVAVGLPLMAPVVELSCKPAGKFVLLIRVQE
jgi:hypothetical protein